MPYTIQKRGSKWCLVRRNGTIKSHHTSKALAISSRNVIMAKEHTPGWKPSGKKRRSLRKKKKK